MLVAEVVAEEALPDRVDAILEVDQVALAEGRVEVQHAHWWTGDWVIMPPPEVLALGVVDVPPGRTWGCGGYETLFDYEEVA